MAATAAALQRSHGRSLLLVGRVPAAALLIHIAADHVGRTARSELDRLPMRHPRRTHRSSGQPQEDHGSDHEGQQPTRRWALIVASTAGLIGRRARLPACDALEQVVAPPARQRAGALRVGSGTVHAKLSVLTRGFQKLGPGVNLVLEAESQQAQLRAAQEREQQQRMASR